MKVAVTGANGFIGTRVVSMLEENNLTVHACIRNASSDGITPETYNRYIVGDIGPNTDWSKALYGTDAVIHTAARVHVMRDTASDPLEMFRDVNVRGTLNLAKQAAEHGVKRFVYVSSIKVNGESTELAKPFTAEDMPAPIDPYGISKFEAERVLFSLADETGLEIAIVRPTLVYGPGVKGNFATIMRALKRGLPLPLGAIIGNKRSLVALDNLASLLITCATHPAAANQIFLVKDGEDLSTTALLTRLGAAMGVPIRLLPVHESILLYGARALGRADLARRLFGSLQVDDSKTREVLSWTPVLDVDEGLRLACNT